MCPGAYAALFHSSNDSTSFALYANDYGVSFLQRLARML